MKVLIIKNNLPFDIDIKPVQSFFAGKIDLEFESIALNIPVSIKVYKQVQGFNPITGKPGPINYYGLSDTIKAQCNYPYDIVIFAWNLDGIKAPTDGAITSWTLNVPISQKTDYIQLAINQYLKNTNGITNRITHEIMHTLCFKANRAGIPTVDEMDVTKDGKNFYKNDDPNATDGNYARTLANLQPYLKSISTKIIDTSLAKWKLLPSLEKKALQFLIDTKNAGYNLKITQGFRDPAYQDKLYAQGRTLPGKIVTNATGKTSKHCLGKAFDIAFVGKDPYPKNADWKAIAQYGKKLGLSWGGDWKSFKDLLHFEI